MTPSEAKALAEKEYPEINSVLRFQYSENDVVFIKRGAFIAGLLYDDGEDANLWKEVEEAIRLSVGLDPYRSNKIVDYLSSKFSIKKIGVDS